MTMGLSVPAGWAEGAPLQASRPAMHARTLADAHGVVLTLLQRVRGEGLVGSVLRVARHGIVRDVPLDTTGTGRRARAVGAAHLLPGQQRAVLHVDPHHDRSGLLVVDLDAGVVVDAVTGRAFHASPDARFWAFEEHAPAHVTLWPHTETVYAVYDATASAAANARPCPTADERCRGTVIYLLDRLTLCHEVATRRAGSCLTPHRRPQHVRRSPFVWVSPTELTFVDADRERQTSALVLATIAPAGVVVQVVPLSHDRVIDGVDFPDAAETWTVDHISRDADPSRLWLHFRSRLPQAPSGRLGVRLM